MLYKYLDKSDWWCFMYDRILFIKGTPNKSAKDQRHMGTFYLVVVLGYLHMVCLNSSWWLRRRRDTKKFM